MSSDLTQSIIDLVKTHGLPELMRMVGAACGVEADIVKDDERSLALVNIGTQILALADDVETLTATTPAPMIGVTDIIRIMDAIAHEGGRHDDVPFCEG